LPEIKTVPVESIRIPEVRVSSVHTPEQRAFLASTIKEIGVISEPVVRVLPGGEYELVAGKGRIEELIAQGHTEVTVKVLEADEKMALIMNVTENVARGGYDYISISRAIRRLRDLGATDVELAKTFPWSLRWIRFLESLQDLPDDVMEGISSGSLSPTHVQEALKLPTPSEVHDGLRTVMRLTWDTGTFKTFVKNRLEQIDHARAEAVQYGRPLDIPSSDPIQLTQYGQCLLCGYKVPRNKLSNQIVCEGCQQLNKYVTSQLGEPEKAVAIIYKALELYFGVQTARETQAQAKEVAEAQE